MDQIISSLQQFWEFTGFCNMTWQHIVMIAIGIVFITLAIVKEWEPLLLVPIGFGMIIGNIPMFPGLNIGVYEDGSVLNILYQGVRQGWYPPLIFLGIGAMTDFSALISHLSAAPDPYRRCCTDGYFRSISVGIVNGIHA